MTSSTRKITSESSEKEKSIFLCLTRSIKSDNKRTSCYGNKRETQYVWYVINNFEENPSRRIGDVGENKLTVFSTMPPVNFPETSRHKSWCVAWKSIIYAFTQQTKPEVFYLDTRCPDLGWKKGPTMCEPRDNLVCAVLDGGIYVMGNIDITTGRYGRRPGTSVDGPWVEIFDPLLNVSQFPDSRPTTPNRTSHVVRAIPYGDKNLLVQFEYWGSLYCYDADDNSWTLIDKQFGKLTHYIIYNSSYVVVEGILYWFDMEVKAYDLAKRRWLLVRGLDKEGVSPILCDPNGWESLEPNHPDAYLVHLGSGKLCLIWPDCDYEEKKMRVHCTKFRVYKDDDGGKNNGILHAIIESFEVYNIDNVDSSIQQLLTI